jgi:hypothetical protein
MLMEPGGWAPFILKKIQWLERGAWIISSDEEMHAHNDETFLYLVVHKCYILIVTENFFHIIF